MSRITLNLKKSGHKVREEVHELSVITFTPNEDKPSVILARVGVSMQSAQQACMNAEDEIPDFDFESVRSDADLQWSELLGRFQVVVDDSDMYTAVLLYSSVSSN